ncbi:MAG: glutathione S-transferase family protein [Pseudomonadota bacterium]
MILLGRNLSPFVRRVSLALDILGLSYDQRPLSTADDRAEILKYNPVGRVPVLIFDDGRTVIDSHAIFDALERHFDRKHPFFPQEPELRDRMLFSDALAVAGMEKLVLWFYETTRRDPKHYSETATAEYASSMAEAMRALSRRITPSGLLCGDEVTMADVTTAAFIRITRDVRSELIPDDVGELNTLADRVFALAGE